jgi:hypothetical protein
MARAGAQSLWAVRARGVENRAKVKHKPARRQKHDARRQLPPNRPVKRIFGHFHRGFDAAQMRCYFRASIGGRGIFNKVTRKKLSS